MEKPVDNPLSLWETRCFSPVDGTVACELGILGTERASCNSIATSKDGQLSTIHSPYYYSFVFISPDSLRKASREVPM